MSSAALRRLNAMRARRTFIPKFTMADKFEKFHADHPEVYAAYEQVCRELWDSGCRRFGSQGVFWVIRWKFAVNKNKDEGYKIPNGYSPHYARKYLKEHPQHDGFFETRELHV